MNKTVELPIGGMTCGACAARVSQGLSDVDGVETATVNLATERANIARHGYGIKGFVLSMVLTAVEISDAAIDARSLAGIVGWGHEMLAHPIELLDGVPEALDALGSTHRLLLITKGDLGDQLDKVRRSGLADRFWRVEVVPEKDPQTYRDVLDRHGIDPAADAVAVLGRRSHLG